MSKINILSAQIYNRIAAGEVVDRPYSVVKELVENAIDAGATEIEIYVEGGGKQLIRVVDNGGGISRDDLHAAFLPHATSKIAKADDLERIMTLGFRGEAVASIAAVSKMTITSKVSGENCYRLTSDGGKLGEIVEAAGGDGTDVSVEMLFFNTPVRLGFLKSDKSEETDITNFVSRFILNRPDISFRYYVGGKRILQSFGGGEEEAVVGVYGASILKDCYKIDASKHGIRLRGYIGNQNFSKPNKTYQSVFLNGRYIINSTISAAVSNAYASYLMKRQYPFYVLYIDMPTEIVDVNVHPNKADVRFADNQTVYGCIYSVISAVLDGQPKALEYLVSDKTAVASEIEAEAEKVMSPKAAPASAVPFSAPKKEKPRNAPLNNLAKGVVSFSYEDARRELEKVRPSKTTSMELPFELESNAEENAVPVQSVPAEKKSLRETYADLQVEKNILEVNSPEAALAVKTQGNSEDFFAENKRFLEELETKAKQNKIDVSSCAYAGKLFNTYLLYERGDEVYIIDQHAAHERLIFDRLKEQMRTRKVLQQPMLLPYVLNLNAFESAFIREKMENIREIGFDIDEFGNNAFKVSAVPLDLQSIDLALFFNEILGDISGYRSIKLEDLLKDKLATAACKAAVKGGMDLTREETDRLFRLMDGNMGLKCPHGRPVVVKMTKTELEKMFKRIV
jgi:DNA mismatch repair protein mutL